MKSLFITFEGIDGCGKTTQIELLNTFLEENGFPVTLTREPGGCTIAEEIREILLSTNSDIGDRGELLLYLAARSEHVRQVIKPALLDKKIVISDRFYDATFAYQGYGRGLDIEKMGEINLYAIEGTVPDITFLLDISVEESLSRREKRGGNPDRIEANSIDFFNKVRDGYLSLAKKEPKRIVVIDGTMSIDNVHSTILDNISKHLNIK